MTSQVIAPDTPSAETGDVLPRLARLPLALIGGVVLAVMLIGSRNYGYFFDEAYFVVAGREHPAAGYFDQPPLVPLLAAGLDHLAHGNLVVLRLPATLAVVAITLLAGLLARELGGRTGAQAFAAAAVAMSLVSSVGHWLATYSLDPLWWTVILYLLVRWVRTRDDRLLLLAGAVTALSLLTKFLVPALWIAIVLGALACGPRRLVTRPALWAGAALAVVAVAPTLWWQAGHDWAYTRMGAVVRAEWPGGAGFALVGLFGAGLLIGLPLLLAGVVALLRSRDLRPYRFLGVALVLVVVAIVLTHGRAYYLASVYALPMAAGAVVAERWLARRGRRAHGFLRAIAVLALLGSAASWIAASPVWTPAMAERIGTPPLRASATMLVDGDTLLQKLSGTVVAAYRTLPPAERDGTVIVAESYPFAAAVDFFGRDEGLPRAYSGHRAYYYFGRPPADARAVLWIGDPSPVLDGAFAHRRAVPAPGDTGDPVVQLYTGRTVAWPELWERLRSQGRPASAVSRVTGVILASIPSPAQGVWHLGPVPIRAYALCIIVGIVVACWWGDRRWVARGGKPGQVLDVAVWAVPFGLVGGRLYHVMTDFSTYFGPNGRGLGAVFRIWDGGLGIWGAVALGGVGAAIGCRKMGIKLGPFADAIAPAIIVAQAIGRLGNWFNQELYGAPTTLPWGLEIYERANDVGQRGPDVLDGHSTGVVLSVVQPTFLYELVWNLLVAAFLVIVDRRFRIGHGRLFALYVAGYCLGRFFIEIMRDDHATLIFGVRINVFTAALVFAGAVAYFLLAPKGREDSVFLDESAAAPSETGTEQDGSTETDAPVALEKADDAAGTEADVRPMDTGGLPGDSTSRNKED